MRPRMIVSVALATATLALAPTAAAAAPVAARPMPALQAVTGLSAERVVVADEVAAAKWGTDQPIDDPAREQQVLADVAAQARQLGTDPDEVVRVFRDQIEASKVVQRGLFRLWTADPAAAPTTRPDLSKVRAEINRINGELVQAIATTTDVRTSPACGGLLTAAYLRTGLTRHLGPLHALALARALPHVCEGGRE